MTHDIDNLADRHFRPDPHGVLAASGEARTARVLIGIDLLWARTKAGQDTIWMLANLLCRQFKLVTSITLDIPSEITLLPRVAAFGEALLLRDAIANCVRMVAGSLVQIGELVAGSDETHEIEVFVGSPRDAPSAPVRLILYADGWRLFLGASRPPVGPPQSKLTLGPYLGACFAAGEVFKRLRGLRQGRGELIGEGHELYLSLWSTKAASSWDQLDCGPHIESTELPPLYFIGAGAVAQAGGLAIAGIPKLTAHMTTIDAESLDLSNDNRYSLATFEDSKKPKAQFLEDFFERRGFGHYSYGGTWQDYVTRQRRKPNRMDLADLESRFMYRLILSCVDDNGARHAIQNLWPNMIIGGSTLGLTAKAITYDMSGDQLCLKCYNPVVNRNELVRKRLDEARAMDSSKRMQFFASLGIDPAKASEHLRDPGCGQLSEQELVRFAEGEPMMSVGFVSVAAGVLLAAQLLRFVHSGRPALVAQGPVLIANFYRPGLRLLKSLPQHRCDCAERRVTDWLPRWPAGT